MFGITGPSPMNVTMAAGWHNDRVGLMPAQKDSCWAGSSNEGDSWNFGPLLILGC